MVSREVELGRRRVAELVVDVPDWPRPGVVFKDITGLLASADGLAAAVTAMVSSAPAGVDLVAATEARGFLFGSAVALALGAGLVPVRKQGRLPRACVSAEAELEYGREVLQVHADAPLAGARVLLVDDVLATGGTLATAAGLLRGLGADVVAASVVLELLALGGAEQLTAAGVPRLDALLRVD